MCVQREFKLQDLNICHYIYIQSVCHIIIIILIINNKFPLFLYGIILQGNKVF